MKVRFVNVVDLFKLVPHTEHPHGLTDREFEALLPPDRPVIFNFHAYPWLIHRLTYRRPTNSNIHVRGYKEKGNIDTPMELAIRNQIDRFSLAIDAIDRMPRFAVTGSSIREALLNEQIACRNNTLTRSASIEKRSPTGSGPFNIWQPCHPHIKRYPSRRSRRMERTGTCTGKLKLRKE